MGSGVITAANKPFNRRRTGTFGGERNAGWRNSGGTQAEGSRQRVQGRGFKAEETLESLDRVHSDGRGDGLNTSYTSLGFPSALEWGGADLGARVAEKGELGDSDWGDRARWAVEKGLETGAESG
ncbi:predicted protein [Histoplasma capsulatum var. duboisii H88]|uniref:Predicted protein n=1 Tax=Ajellomyces capsulatus (strain H88) TaxID=544711 RepID=F0UI34_AJEC8|nr:predicted protein [Histoplasma capsulatum var. duboisii H88]